MAPDLIELVEIRKDILNTPQSSKQKEIADKLDELILAELNKSDTPNHNGTRITWQTSPKSSIAPQKT